MANLHNLQRNNSKKIFQFFEGFGKDKKKRLDWLLLYSIFTILVYKSPTSNIFLNIHAKSTLVSSIFFW